MRLKREAKAKGGFYVEPEAKVVFVVSCFRCLFLLGLPLCATRWRHAESSRARLGRAPPAACQPRERRLPPAAGCGAPVPGGRPPRRRSWPAASHMAGSDRIGGSRGGCGSLALQAVQLAPCSGSQGGRRQCKHQASGGGGRAPAGWQLQSSEKPKRGLRQGDTPGMRTAEPGSPRQPRWVGSRGWLGWQPGEMAWQQRVLSSLWRGAVQASPWQAGCTARPQSSAAGRAAQRRRQPATAPPSQPGPPDTCSPAVAHSPQHPEAPLPGLCSPPPPLLPRGAGDPPMHAGQPCQPRPAPPCPTLPAPPHPPTPACRSASAVSTTWPPRPARSCSCCACARSTRECSSRCAGRTWPAWGAGGLCSACQVQRPARNAPGRAAWQPPAAAALRAPGGRGGSRLRRAALGLLLRGAPRAAPRRCPAHGWR